MTIDENAKMFAKKYAIQCTKNGGNLQSLHVNAVYVSEYTWHTLYLYHTKSGKFAPADVVRVRIPDVLNDMDFLLCDCHVYISHCSPQGIRAGLPEVPACQGRLLASCEPCPPSRYRPAGETWTISSCLWLVPVTTSCR